MSYHAGGYRFNSKYVFFFFSQGEDNFNKTLQQGVTVSIPWLLQPCVSLVTLQHGWLTMVVATLFPPCYKVATRLFFSYGLFTNGWSKLLVWCHTVP